MGLLVEAGDVREVHHVALLIGYGAAAVNPYLAMESVEDLVRAGTFIENIEAEQAIRNLIYALGKGVLKVMSKMGISTVASYRGAQVFEAVGLDEAFVATYFNGTATKIGGATSTSSPRRSPPGTPRRTPRPASRPRTARWRSAASTSGAARANRTCSTRRRSSASSTPPATGATTSSSSTRTG